MSFHVFFLWATFTEIDEIARGKGVVIPSGQNQIVQNFIKENETVEAVELLISDLNGILRGKWAPKDALEKIVDPGMNLPMSIFGLDIWGREVEETGLHIETGDLDGFCCLIDDRVANETWAKRPTAQALLSMKDDKGKTFYACDNFPSCKNMLFGKPTGEICPKCGSLLIDDNKGGVICQETKKCGYKQGDKI